VEIKGGKEQLAPNHCLLYPKSEQVLLTEKKREGSLFSFLRAVKTSFCFLLIFSGARESRNPSLVDGANYSGLKTRPDPTGWRRTSFPLFFSSPLGLLCWADNFEKNGFLAGGPATGTR